MNYLIADHWELVLGKNGKSRVKKIEIRCFSYDEYEFDELDDVFMGGVIPSK